MLFNSLPFLYVFLPLTYVVFWRLRARRQRYAWLTVTGYAFYAFWNYRFCALMATSTAVSFLAGLGLRRWERPRTRRWCLVVPIVLDLGLLAFFKYANFALGAMGDLAAWAGFHVTLPELDVVLPVGISFYTFHTITYVVDCYRRKVVPTSDLLEFSCYVSLFAQLVAGPIVRFGQIEGDLATLDRIDAPLARNRGWSFFAIGLAKKVLVADTIAGVISPLLDGHRTLSTATTWLCMLGYTYQIYFDFSGYSDMAVGLGQLFGLRLPQNFDSPYRAVDPADFWRRWHISLSTVLRDYLYIPLGGSRRGTWHTYRNLGLTMLLGGLWHGASWTFVVWGAYHGVLLALTRLGASAWSRVDVLVRRVMTFALVVVGWTVFRAPSVAVAASHLRTMFTWHVGLTTRAPVIAASLVVAAAFAHFGPNSFELPFAFRPRTAVALVAAFVLSMVCIYVRHQTPFLYFQF